MKKLLCVMVLMQLCTADDAYLRSGIIMRNVKLLYISTQGESQNFYNFQTTTIVRKISDASVIKIDSSVRFNPNIPTTFQEMTNQEKKQYGIPIDGKTQSKEYKLIDPGQNDSLFLSRTFPTEKKIPSAFSVRTDTSSSTELQRKINAYGQFKIIEKNYFYELKQYVFFSTVNRLSIESIRLYLNNSLDTTKGLIVTVHDYQSQYIWRNRTSYIDFDEIESLYRAILETEALYHQWNNRTFPLKHYAQYRTIDDLIIEISQERGEKEVKIIFGTGYTYPTYTTVDFEELQKIKVGLQRAVQYLNQ